MRDNREARLTLYIITVIRMDLIVFAWKKVSKAILDCKFLQSNTGEEGSAIALISLLSQLAGRRVRAHHIAQLWGDNLCKDRIVAGRRSCCYGEAHEEQRCSVQSNVDI